MDPVPAMEVGAEIEVTEDSVLEELPQIGRAHV